MYSLCLYVCKSVAVSVEMIDPDIVQDDDPDIVQDDLDVDPAVAQDAPAAAGGGELLNEYEN